MFRVLSIAILFFLCNNSNASDLVIENIVFHRYGSNANVQFDISWNNSWNNENNKDAIWVFCKFVSANDGYRHALIAEDGHKVISSNGVKLKIETVKDQIGLFLSPNTEYRGSINARIEVKLNGSSLERVPFSIFRCKIFGIEMVNIPSGSFTVGDGDSISIKKGSFFASNGEGNPNGLVEISSEAEIAVSENKGDLYYIPENSEYQGDQKGPIPNEFPKGYKSFYVMKYEVTQGQYVDFLNTLNTSQSQARANFGGKNYSINRGSISYNNKYMATNINQPLNWIGWDDGMAFADWAGLRPMTELEYTKAARGPTEPFIRQFPWNTSSTDNIRRNINETNGLETTGWDEKDLNDNNKDIFGASYYWVMDLSGSLWERVITIGDEKGRAFNGNHGNGVINGHGYANVETWPEGDNTPGGYGFKGGGYYQHGHNFNEFLPFSPISYRVYAAWSGGYRTIAYGQRFVRTAD